MNPESHPFAHLPRVPVAASLIVSAVLAACGGGSGSSADPGAQAGPTDPQAAVIRAASADPQVCFYEHTDYQGASFCTTASSSWVGGTWNDRISSVRVPAGYKVQMFQDINYGGGSLTLTADSANMVAQNFNDQASSFTVTAPPPVDGGKVSGIQIAQSMLYNSDDPELVLVAGKAALVKVNVVSTGAGNKPSGSVRVDNVNGGGSRDLLLAAPATALPTGVPDVPSFSDSYTATIPADLVKAGLRLTVQVGSSAATTLTPRVGGGQSMQFVPISVRIAGVAGTVPADLAAHIQSMFPVASVTTVGHAAYNSTRVPTLPATDDAWSDAFGKILGELADLHSIENASDTQHYFGYLPKRTWGLLGLAYVPGSAGVAFDMPGAPDSVRDATMHELGHNFSLPHAACGGAGSPDPAYPYPDANLGKAGRYIWPFFADTQSFFDPRPTDRHDTMSYCGGQAFSDYNYRKMQVFVTPADKTQAQASAARMEGAPAEVQAREVLLVSGELRGSAVELNPVKSFVGKPAAAASAEAAAGGYALHVVSASGSFDYPFSPMSLDHNTTMQHFSVAIPNPGALQSLTVVRHGQTLAQAQAQAAATSDDKRAQAASAGSTPLQARESAGQLRLSWDARKTPFVTVTWVGANGQRVTLAQDLRNGSAALPTHELPAGGSFELIFSDGLNSTRQSVGR